MKETTARMFTLLCEMDDTIEPERAGLALDVLAGRPLSTRKPDEKGSKGIVVTVEGGLVQGVSTDDPSLVGRRAVVIDYDFEGADPDEVEQVPQAGGETVGATISRHEVGVLTNPVAEYLKARQ